MLALYYSLRKSEYGVAPFSPRTIFWPFVLSSQLLHYNSEVFMLYEEWHSSKLSGPQMKTAPTWYTAGCWFLLRCNLQQHGMGAGLVWMFRAIVKASVGLEEGAKNWGGGTQVVSVCWPWRKNNFLSSLWQEIVLQLVPKCLPTEVMLLSPLVE